MEDALNALPEIIEERTARLLDEKGACAGNVTSTQLKTAIKDAIGSALREANLCQPRDAADAAGEQELPRIAAWHTWSDRSMHRLPEGYVLTRRGTAASAWHARTAIQAYHRWNMPDLANQVCAIKNCEPGDFSEKNQRKRFSDWKRVCTGLDALLRREGLPVIRKPTVAECTSQFKAAFQLHMTLVKYLHPSKKKRTNKRGASACALKVSTVLKDMRAVRDQSERFVNLLRIQLWWKRN